jgi:hypothetical protein
MLLVDAFLPAAQSRLLEHRIEPRQTLLIRRQGSTSARFGAVFVQGQASSYGPVYPPKW